MASQRHGAARSDPLGPAAATVDGSRVPTAGIGGGWTPHPVTRYRLGQPDGAPALLRPRPRPRQRRVLVLGMWDSRYAPGSAFRLLLESWLTEWWK